MTSHDHEQDTICSFQKVTIDVNSMLYEWVHEWVPIWAFHIPESSKTHQNLSQSNLKLLYVKVLVLGLLLSLHFQTSQCTVFSGIAEQLNTHSTTVTTGYEPKLQDKALHALSLCLQERFALIIDT